MNGPEVRRLLSLISGGYDNRSLTAIAGQPIDNLAAY